MAVIARKQLTGSTQKIKEYAGHEGQLVFDKQTKHLHVLSGTAGKTTELANKSDIPTVDGGNSDYIGTIKSLNFDVNTGAVTVVKSNDTVVPRRLATDLYVADKLKTKEDKGTAFSKEESDSRYATLEGLQKYQITINGVSAMSNTFKKSVDEGRLSEYTLTEPGGETAMVLLGADEGNAKTILNNILAGEHFEEPYYVRTSGSRGILAGWEDYSTLHKPEVTETTSDFCMPAGNKLVVKDPESPVCYTKVVMVSASTTVELGGTWRWAGGSAPQIENGLLVLCYANSFGIASYIKFAIS